MTIWKQIKRYNRAGEYFNLKCLLMQRRAT